MKTQIEDKITEIYKTKAEFCRLNGYNRLNLGTRINSAISSISRVNKFLGKLNLRVILTSIK